MPSGRGHRWSALAAGCAIVVGAVAGCSAGPTAPESPSPSSVAVPTPTPTPSAFVAPTPTGAPVTTRPTDARLRRELLTMLAADQKSRTSADGDGVAGDRARTERLRAIIVEHGWPTRSAVGRDGASAAWAIAQHSDLDPEFQQQVLALMQPAVVAGEAGPGDYAYLVDRVAANAGRPQVYGTQMGCATDGTPQLAPLAEPDRVEQLRAEAGLPTLADYLAELEKVCADS